MRYINRRLVPAPFVLKSSAAMEFRAETARYLARDDRGERPPKIPYEILEHEELAIALDRLFNDVCAYCEQPLDGERAVDAFRPTQGAENLDGQIAYQHYCWLGLEWANLYLACLECLHGKRNRFPARRRGALNATIAQLRQTERDTLIDPCLDIPSEHFGVGSHGQLFARSQRGETTIEVLELNREPLRADRAHIVRMLRSASVSLAIKVECVTPGAPYAGIAWLAVLENLPPQLARRYRRRPPNSKQAIANLLRVAYHPGYSPGEEYDWRPEDTHRRRYVKSVRVQNFRGIRNAVIVFPAAGKGDTKAAGSLIMLGDNGAGKTSMLQACALGCLGPSGAQEAGIKPGKCLTQGEEEGQVIVEFWGTKRTNLVSFSSGSSQFDGRAEVPVMVLGYGAYRLAALAEVGEENRGYDYRVKSLFDERALVNGALGLRDHLRLADANGTPDRLEDATRALNAVLRGRARARLSPDRDLVVHDGEREQPLAELSSGFKSVIALVADIMDVMYEVWNGMTSAQAMILVDEIDAHLHPSWRLAIVEALRDTFPLAQFLMTTHDPLPLRGLGQGEIAILSRGEDGLDLEYPPVRAIDGMSVDQILTSDLFGLSTTLDEDTSRRLANYYRLLALPARNPAQDLQLAAAEDSLPPEVPVGDDPRQRLMYRMLDEYLARHSDRRADKLSEEMVRELVDLFEEAEKEVIARDLEAGT